MPRPRTPKAAPRGRTKPPARSAPKGPRAPAPATPPPAPQATPPQAAAPFSARPAVAGIFRACTRREKAFKHLSLRITETEARLYERARSCAALLDDSAEALPASEALRRLAMVGAEALGLVVTAPAATP